LGDAAQVGSNLAKGEKLVKPFWIAPARYRKRKVKRQRANAAQVEKAI